MDRQLPISPSAKTDLESGNRDIQEVDKEFYKKIDVCKSLIARYQELTAAVQHAHEESLRSVEEATKARLSKQIERDSFDANDCAREISTLLTTCTEDCQEAAKGRLISGSSVRVRNSLISAITSKFSNAVKSLQNVHVAIKLSHEDQLRRQYLLVNPQATPEELAQVVQNADSSEMQQLFSRGLAKQEAQETLDRLMNRQQILLRLEKNILTLHQMFQDMQMLLRVQSKTIELIDEDVEVSDKAIGAVVTDMKQAVSYQKKAWKMKMIFTSCIGGIVIIGGIVLIFWLKDQFK